MANAENPRFSFADPNWLEETPSTNDVLKERITKSGQAPSGTVVAARRQTRGKGRMGGVWHSSPEGDLTFSFVWRGQRAPVQAATLPMACALAVRDFLALPPWRIPTLCKWPNDVLVGDAKICGILAEGGPTGVGEMCLVVGIGVNVRRVSGRDRDIGRPTAAMDDFYPGIGNPEELLPILLGYLAERIGIWERGGFESIHQDLSACLWGVGVAVSAKTPSGPVRGTVAGLGQRGGLLLCRDDGEVLEVASVTALDNWELPSSPLVL